MLLERGERLWDVLGVRLDRFDKLRVDPVRLLWGVDLYRLDAGTVHVWQSVAEKGTGVTVYLILGLGHQNVDRAELCGFGLLWNNLWIGIQERLLGRGNHACSIDNNRSFPIISQLHILRTITLDHILSIYANLPNLLYNFITDHNFNLIPHRLLCNLRRKEPIRRHLPIKHFRPENLILPGLGP
jgi:hypothetical protein